MDINNPNERLSQFAKALSHPARVAILQLLIEKCACCGCGDCSLCKGCHDECGFFRGVHTRLNLSKASVSQHLAELKKAGLVKCKEEPPRVKYRVDSENWALARKLFNDLLGLCSHADFKHTETL